MRKRTVIEGVEPTGRMQEPRNSSPPSLFEIPGVTIGKVLAVIRGIGPLIDYPGNASGELVIARTLVPVAEKDLDSEVALTFENHDRMKPLILGIIRSFDNGLETTKATPLTEVKLDQDVLLLTANKQIVLRCGNSSITLTREGKLLIEGKYVVSESSGVNKIRGGSVQIN